MIVNIDKVPKFIRGEIRYFVLNCLQRKDFHKTGKLFLSKTGEIVVNKTGQINIGKHLTVENGALLASRANSEISVGNNVYINRNCHIVSHESIRIGSNVTIGPNTCIIDHDHDTYNRGLFNSAPIVIDDNVWIGANVVVLNGVHIGLNSIIGAGSIVLKDIPPNSVFVQKRKDCINNMIND